MKADNSIKAAMIRALSDPPPKKKKKVDYDLDDITRRLRGKGK